MVGPGKRRQEGARNWPRPPPLRGDIAADLKPFLAPPLRPVRRSPFGTCCFHLLLLFVLLASVSPAARPQPRPGRALCAQLAGRHHHHHSSRPARRPASPPPQAKIAICCARPGARPASLAGCARPKWAQVGAVQLVALICLSSWLAGWLAGWLARWRDGKNARRRAARIRPPPSLRPLQQVRRRTHTSAARNWRNSKGARFVSFYLAALGAGGAPLCNGLGVWRETRKEWRRRLEAGDGSAAHVLRARPPIKRSHFLGARQAAVAAAAASSPDSPSPRRRNFNLAPKCARSRVVVVVMITIISFASLPRQPASRAAPARPHTCDSFFLSSSSLLCSLLILISACDSPASGTAPNGPHQGARARAAPTGRPALPPEEEEEEAERASEWEDGSHFTYLLASCDLHFWLQLGRRCFGCCCRCRRGRRLLGVVAVVVSASAWSSLRARRPERRWTRWTSGPGWRARRWGCSLLASTPS